MTKKAASRLQELDQQIRNLEIIKKRWEKGEGLNRKQMAVRELTLELLDGAIKDLLIRRQELIRANEKD
ncbi:MAG: hypothetical protein WHX93_15400 [bacterium]